MLRKTLLAATAALTMLASTANAEQRWYTGHLNAEQCVPLDDIGWGPNGPERLYYGSGSMRTPEDFVTVLRKLGANITPITDESDAKLYVGTFGKMKTNFMFFNGEGLCKYVMHHMDKYR